MVKHEKKVYHVVANLENRFPSLEAARKVYNVDTPVAISVPETIKMEEDRTTARLCVARDLCQCFTGIGLLGRFRRCLAGNEDAFSYETQGREVYPILVLEFKDVDVTVPTKEQVPDIEATGELWITESLKPSKVTPCWLTMRSIIWDDDDCRSCRSVDLLSEPSAMYDHPWLNGRGHYLESSEEETSYKEEK